MKILRKSLAALVVASLSLGCSDDSGDSPGGAGTGGSAGAGGAGPGGGAGSGGGAAVSFAADIHPILTMKCSDQASQCHSSISNGPFQPGHAATDVGDAYAATQGLSSAGEPIYERILARITLEGPQSMPPPYANPPCEGAIGEPGCISETELALIEAWIEQGTPP